MPLVDELLKFASKAASQTATLVTEFSKNPQAVVSAFAVKEAAEELGKETGILKTNRLGGLYIKVPLFKSKEERINQIFALHPDRNKVCFRFTDSIRDGVNFYDPDGLCIFEIHSGKQNLRQLDLYEDGRFAGRIQKIVTLSLNPLADKQDYKAQIRGSSGIITVSWFTASSDIFTWHMTHKIGKDFIIENTEGKEIARFYSLKSAYFVFDYVRTADPVEMLLAFMAIKIKSEESKHNQQLRSRGGPLGRIEAEIKDIF